MIKKTTIEMDDKELQAVIENYIRGYFNIAKTQDCEFIWNIDSGMPGREAPSVSGLTIVVK